MDNSLLGDFYSMKSDTHVADTQERLSGENTEDDYYHYQNNEKSQSTENRDDFVFNDHKQNKLKWKLKHLGN
jgi:hypothetical protein